MYKSGKNFKNLVLDKIIFGKFRKNGLGLFNEFRSFQKLFKALKYTSNALNNFLQT